MALNLSLSGDANANNFKSGDILGLNGPSFAYANKNDSYTVPSGMRLRVVEKRADGSYIVQPISSWTAGNGQTRTGHLLHGQNKIAVDENLRLTVYPSRNAQNDPTLVFFGHDPVAATAFKTQSSTAPTFLSEGKSSGHTNASLTQGQNPNNKTMVRVKTRGSDLIVRSGPSQNHAILSRLPNGSSVEVLKSGDWSQIRGDDGIEGYVSSDYLERASAPMVSASGDCLNYNPEVYSGASVEKFTQAQRGERDTARKKKAFFDYFAPLALHLQEISGYPASVMLAQWSAETGWGTSNVLEKAKNIAGQSCFGFSREVKKIKLDFPNGKSATISRSCDQPRPASEKYWYFRYTSAADSGYAYVHNLVANPKTARPYSGVRKAVQKAARGESSGQELRDEVIAGLGSYATDPDYQKNLRAALARDRLARFDEMRTCR